MHALLRSGKGSPDHFISKPNSRAWRWGHFIWNPNPPSQMLIGLVQGITKASGGSQARENTATQNKMFSKWICFFTNSHDSPPGVSSRVWRLLELQMAVSNDNVQATLYPTRPPQKNPAKNCLLWNIQNARWFTSTLFSLLPPDPPVTPISDLCTPSSIASPHWL